MVALTFLRDGPDVMMLTGSGAVPIDASFMLDALQASHDALLREDTPRIFHARKLRALHAQLSELVQPQTVIPIIRPITTRVRQLDPSLWRTP